MNGKSILVVSVVVVAAAAGFGARVLLDGRTAAPSDGAGVPGGWRFENPLAMVEPGEWALYRTLDGKKMRIEVLSVDSATREITLREERRDPEADALVSQETRKIGPNHFLWGFEGAGAIVTAVSPEALTVAGRKIPCLCIETIGQLMGKVRHYYSQEIPAIGLVRQTSVRGDGDRNSADLLDWSGRR